MLGYIFQISRVWLYHRIKRKNMIFAIKRLPIKKDSIHSLSGGEKQKNDEKMRQTMHIDKMVRVYFLVSLLIQTVPLAPCGLALVYAFNKQSDTAQSLQQLYLLMYKQRNRGQDGAGIALISCSDQHYSFSINNVRSADRHALEEIYPLIKQQIEESTAQKEPTIFMGFVRYGTYGGTDQMFCQPQVRENHDTHRALVLAGNFNMTNMSDIHAWLAAQGKTNLPASDSEIILELLCYFLNQESVDTPDLVHVLQKCAPFFDGGYVLMGTIHNGDTFVCRDPAGIRSCFYHATDERICVASERAALATVCDTDFSNINEILPGHALIIKHDGTVEQKRFAPSVPLRQCAFERIYLSRGNDGAISRERKALGRFLAPRILELLNNDLSHAIFTYVPNSSEIAFQGMIEELERLTGQKPRVEKILYKDQVMRTFIANPLSRPAMTAYAYDVTQDIVTPEDTLIALDDSIVRGTTIKNIVQRLTSIHPKKIIIASAAPLIAYPDCYGIDTSQIGDLIGFQALIERLKETDRSHLVEQCADECSAQIDAQTSDMHNAVQNLYTHCTLQELEKKIASMVYPSNTDWSGELAVVYQSVEGLARAMPEHTGDWYFTGNYPTSGGFKVLNRSYVQWYRGNKSRAY
jgi:amidophosphoribosyltransferase